MGGFTLIDPDCRDTEPNEQNGVVLTFDYFKQNPNIKIPEITVAEIEDQSKGDVLFKLIQCIARGQQRLALTELELVTLALACLNGNAATFAVWWHKPLGVQEPVKIYLKTEARIAIVENAARPKDPRVHLSFGDVIGRGWKDIKEISTYVPSFVLFVVIPISVLCRVPPWQ